jgi:membrane protein
MTSRTELADRAAHRARTVLAWRILAGPLEFGRDWLLGFVRLQGFDRAVALAGQAFTALIPLLIVYSAIVSSATGEDFADKMISALELKGSTAAAVRQAFAPAGEVESEVSLIGSVLLVGSALSFTRALQRLYQLSWDQAKLGLRAAKWGLIWLVVVIAIVTLRPIILDGLHGIWLVALTIGFATCLWLVTPYVLLARRIGWQRLVPTALLTAVGMLAIEISSAVWMPHTMATSAEQFGLIGIAFVLLSWLVGAGMVLVVAAAGGAVIDERLRRRSRA